MIAIFALLWCFAGVINPVMAAATYESMSDEAGPSSRGNDVVFPEKHWEIRTPAQVGLDAAKLEKFAATVGGRGCIVKDGYMVYSWGDIKSKSDWASAMKPVMKVSYPV